MPGPRPLSGLERVWLVADRLLPPFVIQLVLEGVGSLSPTRVAAAVDQACQTLPGARVRLRGWLGAARWEHDGPVPVVVEEEAPDWDGRSEQGAPFLRRRLHASGPVAEVVLLEGRIVLRVLHAAMDGRGLLLFADALFAALRGDPVPVATDPCLHDAALVPTLQRPLPARDAVPVCPLGTGPGTVWRRASLQGPVSDLLPRVLLALAGAHVRIDVPVDLRRHHPDLRTTANATGLVRLELRPDTDVRAALDQALDRQDEAAFVTQGDAVRGVPLWLMTWVGRRQAALGLRTGRVSTSATVTNLGRLELAALSCPGWRCTSAFVLPPGSPDLPLLLAITGHDNGIELCAVCPTGGQPQPVLDHVLAALAAPASTQPPSGD